MANPATVSLRFDRMCIRLRTCAATGFVLMTLSLSGCSGCTQKSDPRTPEPEPRPSASTTAEPVEKPIEQPKGQDEAVAQDTSGSPPGDSSDAAQQDDAGEAGSATEESGNARPARSTESGKSSGVASIPVDANDNSGGGGEPATGKSPPGGPKDAATARRQATKALDRAEKAAGSGDFGRAFQESVTAWRSVLPFRADPQCKSLASSAEQKMKQYAEAANSAVPETPSSAKPLSVK
ncbi:MAG: hypothetical protein HYX69_17865 [Planctomycetia bacterium]|nr:hypothetical protein [Planctomycetia bacterium]